MVLLPIRGLRGGSSSSGVGRRASPGPLSPGRRHHGARRILRFLAFGGCISLCLTMILVSGLFTRGGVGLFGLEERAVAAAAALPADEANGLWENHRHQQDLETAEYVLKDSSSSSSGQGTTDDDHRGIDAESGSRWEFVSARDGDNYGLSEEQCNIAFPKLFVELEKSVKQREANGSMITAREMQLRKVDDGMVRGIIYNGELYVVEYAEMRYTYSRAKATLNALNRALAAMPNRHELPNIEFVFSTDDFVDEDDGGNGVIWSYSKRDRDEHIWLMPDFGYWSWPEVKVGPYREIRRRIAAIDDGSWIGNDFVPGLNFNDKKKQLVWRGSPSTAPELRGMLLRQARNKSWASVRTLHWDDEDDLRLNLLPMEEHCRYMFLAHTEGRSFSGRGKYLLNCRSVMITHPLMWREAHHAAFVSSGADVNYVEVAEDFSDLERKIEYLIDHPEVAERIANNSVATFRDRYLTPAAEACFWRALIRQYASVCDFEPQLYTTNSRGEKTMRGTPFESWLLMKT